MLHEKETLNRNKMIYRSYRRPTFISGLASLFDLFNAQRTQKIYFSYSDDFKLISNDFSATGLDLKKAINIYTLKSNINNRKSKAEYSY